MTIVPLRALTITFAAGLAGLTSMSCRRLTKETFCPGSDGALTLIDEESSATATAGPKTSLIASATLIDVLKSD